RKEVRLFWLNLSTQELLVDPISFDGSYRRVSTRLIKQEIKTGVICFGRRVYRVVHSTDIRNVK
ncbi:hypothetical protein ACSLS1_27690, partial [Klebsiella pneumoniae]